MSEENKNKNKNTNEDYSYEQDGEITEEEEVQSDTSEPTNTTDKTEQERLTEAYTNASPMARLKWMFTDPKTYFKGANGHKGNKIAYVIIAVFLIIVAFGGCSALGTSGHSMETAYEDAKYGIIEGETGINEDSYFVPLENTPATKLGDDTYSFDIQVEPGDGYRYTYDIDVYYDDDGSVYWEYAGPY